MRPDELPSFSIVIETENLAKTELARFHRCMEALANQSLPVTQANEVILVESGDVSLEIINQITMRFPWLIHHRSKQNTNYYEAKMEGAARVTGEIVVFCDSDCIYDSNWLNQMLQPFGENERIHIVSGETAMAITGSFSLAVALIWGFPTFSRSKDIYEVAHYAANNVAFRREFLVQHPIPSESNFYRGNCAIHAIRLREQGYKIWKQDAAITLHPLPARDSSEFFWRLLVMGPDWLTWHRLATPSRTEQKWIVQRGQDILTFCQVVLRWVFRPVLKLPRALRENPRHLVFVPLAVPIVIAGILIFVSGFFLGHFWPNSIRTRGVAHLEGLEQPTGTH